MNGDNAPVTRAELKAELATFKAELKAELRAELRAELKTEFPTKDEMKLEITTAMTYVVDALGARMDRLGEEIRMDAEAMRAELSGELAGHVRAATEDTRRFINSLDDRYRDLPGRVTVLEREIDEHRRDTALHRRRRR